MMRILLIGCPVLCLVGFLVSCTVNKESTKQYGNFHLLKRTLVGGDGFWDYVTVASETRQLYLSHGSEVVVLNADTHERLGTIAGQGIHGVTHASGLDKGFITNGRTNSVTVFDTKTFRKITEIPVGKNPDAGLYDSYSKRIFVFNADGDNVTVIDPVGNKVLDSLALGGAPEAGVSDEKGIIYVNLEDKNEMVAFDAKTLKVLQHMSLAPGEEPTGLAMDVKNQLLFSVCHNQLMLILDAKSGKVIAKVPIGEQVDGVVYDATQKVAISSNGEGTLTIVEEINPTTFSVLQTVKTQPGARTIALDTKTHHIFTVTAELGDRPAPTKENPTPRRKIVPGTFSVMEYGD